MQFYEQTCQGYMMNWLSEVKEADFFYPFLDN